jgi:hypothetical protein
MTITERRLRRLFADQGFDIIRLRQNKHWVSTVARRSGGPQFNVACSVTPSDVNFERQFIRSLCKAERAAASR